MLPSSSCLWLLGPRSLGLSSALPDSCGKMTLFLEQLSTDLTGTVNPLKSNFHRFSFIMKYRQLGAIIIVLKTVCL